MKKINKKVLMTLSVLSTPFALESLLEDKQAKANTAVAGQYNLVTDVNVYGTAANASQKLNSKKTYTQGTYHIYKEYNGMINISKVKGKAGAWINPLENATTPVADKKETKVQIEVKEAQPVAKSVSEKATVESQKPKQETTKTPVSTTISTDTAAGTYVLNNSVSTYVNAASASSQTKARSTYQAGNYYIFKEYNGMLNITKVKGRAGAWINPLENVTARVVKEEKLAKTVQAEVVSKVEKTPEIDKVVEKKAVEQKPEEKKVVVESPQVKPSGTFKLSAATAAYANALSAANQTNSKSMYQAGDYYIFKEYNGMLNITKVRGRAGAWINPTLVPSAKALEVKKDEPKLTNTVAESKTKTNVESNLVSSKHQAKSMPFASKKYQITSPWGIRRSIDGLGVHNGVDFVTGNKREPILATDEGIVLKAGTSNDGAERVIIKHAEDSYTAYWHLAPRSIMVKAGDRVNAGQQIGIMGTTGRSTGIHLHFSHGLTPDIFSSHQDPMKYLKNVSGK